MRKILKIPLLFILYIIAVIILITYGIIVIVSSYDFMTESKVCKFINKFFIFIDKVEEY